MKNAEPTTVTRTISIDATADAVWRSLVDETELSAWFGATVEMDAVAGGLARFDDGVTVRRAVVHAVEDGRRLGFTWWDEAHPDDARTVELRVDAADGPAAPVRLTVTETVAIGGSAGGARACSWTGIDDAWTDRLDRMAARIDGRPSPVMVRAGDAGLL